MLDQEMLPQDWNLVRVNGAAEVYVPASNVSDSAQSMPTVPHEGLAHAGGIHGLYDLFLFTRESGSFSGVFL